MGACEESGWANAQGGYKLPMPQTQVRSKVRRDWAWQSTLHTRAIRQAVKNGPLAESEGRNCLGVLRAITEFMADHGEETTLSQHDNLINRLAGYALMSAETVRKTLHTMQKHGFIRYEQQRDDESHRYARVLIEILDPRPQSVGSEQPEAAAAVYGFSRNGKKPLREKSSGVYIDVKTLSRKDVKSLDSQVVIKTSETENSTPSASGANSSQDIKASQVGASPAGPPATLAEFYQLAMIGGSTEDKARERAIGEAVMRIKGGVVDGLNGAKEVAHLFGVVRRGYEQHLEMADGDFDRAYEASCWAWRKLGRVPLPKEWQGDVGHLVAWHKSWLFGNTREPGKLGEWGLLYREWREECVRRAEKPKPAIPDSFKAQIQGMFQQISAEPCSA